ncbi:MAG TPA: LysR family transcriptional regulator [Myxococcaceae bacterium]|nr:LysR family transcriptional regulator [Myxococcaceae bacterium]
MAARWDDLRFVLALARHGTLTAAAASLGVTQPTVGRRLAALERRMRTPLFERTPTGYRPSEAGQELAIHAARIEELMVAAERVSSDRRNIRGSVRVTASEWLCLGVLGPALGRLGDIYPELTVELMAEARRVDVFRGESDIAVRAGRFEHPGLVQRRIAVAEVGLYGSPAYLARHGQPDLRSGSPGHRFLTLTDDAGFGDVAWLRAHASAAQVTVRANGRMLLGAVAAAGGGLTCLPRLVGDEMPELERVPASPGPPGRELWLGMRADRRSLPRVRAVADLLARALEEAQPRLAPGAAPPRRGRREVSETS